MEDQHAADNLLEIPPFEELNELQRRCLQYFREGKLPYLDTALYVDILGKEESDDNCKYLKDVMENYWELAR